MKIDQQAKSRNLSGFLRDPTSVRTGATEDFSMQLDSAVQKQDEAELDLLFGDVTQTGEVLITEQSMEAVELYRKAVRRLVEHVVKQGLHVVSGAVSDRTGRRKLYMTVDEIDKRLLEMAQSIILKQHNALNILRDVGEIKGLLISLRM